MGTIVYIRLCCVQVTFVHRTYNNGLRPQGDLERSMIERVQLKLFSMQQAGQAPKLHSRIVANDARRLVALLP